MIDRAKLRTAWGADTSYYHKFNVSNPAAGQCVPTTLLVQDILGGDIYGCKVGQSRHFYNIVDGNLIDYTADQFYDAHEVVAAYAISGYKADRKQLLRNDDVQQRYQILKDRYDNS